MRHVSTTLALILCTVTVAQARFTLDGEFIDVDITSQGSCPRSTR